MGGPAPKTKNLSPNSLILEMEPLKGHTVLNLFFGCGPPILRKLGSKFFFRGPPQPKRGGREKVWRRGAVALSDRYVHRKFQIDTTPTGDAIRVIRNLETPTYNIKKITPFELTFELLHTALIEKNFKPS